MRPWSARPRPSHLAANATASGPRTFAFTGSEQTYHVPAGIHSVRVKAIGAPGGDKVYEGAGGYGAKLVADLAVTPGQTLYVEKIRGDGDGCRDATAGSNGGGVPTDADTLAGYGGGASDVRLKPRESATTLPSRVVVAGGGGGAGSVPSSDFAIVGGNAGEDGEPPEGRHCGEPSRKRLRRPRRDPHGRWRAGKHGQNVRRQHRGDGRNGGSTVARAATAATGTAGPVVAEAAAGTAVAAAAARNSTMWPAAVAAAVRAGSAAPPSWSAWPSRPAAHPSITITPLISLTVTAVRKRRRRRHRQGHQLRQDVRGKLPARDPRDLDREAQALAPGSPAGPAPARATTVVP